MSSPLESSEKVGRRSWEMISGSQARRPILGCLTEGAEILLSSAVGIAATAVLRAAVAACFLPEKPVDYMREVET